MSDNQSEIAANLRELNRQLDDLLSWKRNFLMGLVRGVGITIGTTIVAGLILAWLAATINTLEDIPILGPLFEQIDERVDIPSTTEES